MIRTLLIYLCLAGVAPSLLAHDTGATFVRLKLENQRLIGRWEIDIHDLADALVLGPASDRRLASNDLSASFSAITNRVSRHLKLRADEQPVHVEISNGTPRIVTGSGATNLVLELAANGVGHAKTLELTYDLFFDEKPRHRGLLLLECPGVTHTAMFSPEQKTQRFSLAASASQQIFLSFGRQGIWHIWIGADHVLFLLALLLPSVLRRHENGWQPVTGFREAFVNVLKIVTAFTVAHSITLSLSVLQWVTLPARWVEAAIAVSVMAAALNNFWPVRSAGAWGIAFALGLIHGFGFANVLLDLGLPAGALAWALVGFNVGVELGQLAIVLLFLPMAYRARATRFYQNGVLRIGSLLIALIAAVWLVDRL